MDRARVLVVDDYDIYRWALAEALSMDPTLEIVAEASNGHEAVEKARALKPDVVFMDLRMPNCDGAEATRRLRAELPEIKVLINTVSEHKSDLLSSLEAGARGYVLKEGNLELTLQAIQYVARGGMIVSPSMATKLLREFKARRPGVNGVAGGPPTSAQRSPGQRWTISKSG